MNITNPNDWNTVYVGKAEIVLNRDDTISHVNHGRVHRVGIKAEEYVLAHPKLAAALEKFWLERRDAISSWKHNTPHFRYDCDGGSLAVRINGTILKIGNHEGDGNHPVYVISDKAVMDTEPPEFVYNGLSIPGPATLEVLGYDCDPNAKVLTTVEIAGGDSAWFKVGNSGAILIEIG